MLLQRHKVEKKHYEHFTNSQRYKRYKQVRYSRLIEVKRRVKGSELEEGRGGQCSIIGRR